MVNKFVVGRLALIAVLIGFIAVVFMATKQEPPAPPPAEKVILEMTMYPITDSPGEFLLVYWTQYANKPAEWLQKDGKRLKGSKIVMLDGKDHPAEYMIQDGENNYLFTVVDERATYRKLPFVKQTIMNLPGPETDKYRVPDKK